MELPNDIPISDYIGENGIWTFYRNDLARIYQEHLEEYDQNGFTLKGMFKVIMAYHKTDGYTKYLIIDKDGKPFADWSTPDEFRLKQMLILADLKDDADIVRMAERRMLE